MTQNQIAYWNMQETMRSNRAREAETHRSNRANESLTGFRYVEEARHNRAGERETNRHNVADETERHRSNVADETERNRHNLIDEAEEHRHNVQSEYGNYANAAARVVSKMVTPNMITSIPKNISTGVGGVLTGAALTTGLANANKNLYNWSHSVIPELTSGVNRLGHEITNTAKVAGSAISGVASKVGEWATNIGSKLGPITIIPQQILDAVQNRSIYGSNDGTNYQ